MDGTHRKFQYKHMNIGRKRRDIKQPRRERLLVKEALSRLGLRYWEMVEIHNPNYTNRLGEVIGGQQWVDYIVVEKGTLFAIEFYPRWGKNNPHQYQLRWMEEKKSFLLNRGIQTLVVARHHSSQEYWGYIYIFLRTRHRHSPTRHGSR